MKNKVSMMLLTAVVLACSAGVHAVDMEWVTVGDAGNMADDTGYGSVGYVYRIGKYEVTAGQYCEFLNAVAATDTYGLYNTSMWSGCKIDRSGTSGSYNYSVATDYANLPVNFVSFWDALRFANWMHNGQPTGMQDASTTEDGAYTFTGATSVGPRNTGAQVWLTNEDEWHKAAYYKGGCTNAGYWDYATQSDTPPTAEVPPGIDLNGSANYNNVIGHSKDVGAYTTKPSNSPYGTFDQNGNLWERVEPLIGSEPGMRGASYASPEERLRASYRYTENHSEGDGVGFRVASAVPPCWVEQAKLLASDGTAGDLFGASVSISGDYAVVGAQYDDDNGTDSGSAYIFKREGESWIEQVKLTASDGEGGDQFGYLVSVSISGNYAIVGAPFNDANGTDSGSAYIFKRSENPGDPNWYQQTKLTASDCAEGDRFGISVSMSGDYTTVGADRDDDNGTDSGSAYIFKRDGESWIQQTKLTSPDGADRDHFGCSVSICGDYAIVGDDSDDAGTNSGGAYIFKRSNVPSDSNWYQVGKKLTASDSAASDNFGNHVSISGNYTIVGAWGDDDNGSYSGSAYIFKRSFVSDDPNWYEVGKLTPSNGAAGDFFGASVSISGDYAIVGAEQERSSRTGFACIFKREGNNWTEQAKLIGSDSEAYDEFGRSVSISGGYAVVGAHFDDDQGNKSGSAYVFKNICEPAVPDIDVSPLSHDFGDVELGTSSTVVVTISNLGNGDLTVSGIALETDFAITSVPPASVVVEPSETVDVEITYTPSALGYNSAVLKITSDDPDEHVVEVTLGAVGIEIPLPPSEQIANILAFFDEFVEQGTLQGRGRWPCMAKMRLKALRYMIKAAGDLIDGEWYGLACLQLRRILLRCDDKPWPPDFVQGEAVPQLASMVQELRDSLGCE